MAALVSICYGAEDSLVEEVVLWRGGTHLDSPHLGGRGRRICELEGSLVYMLNSKTGLNRETLSYRKKM